MGGILTSCSFWWLIPARNLTDEEKKAHREVRWDDKEVCGCYLVRFCPHDLFVNTKSDLGEYVCLSSVRMCVCLAEFYCSSSTVPSFLSVMRVSPNVCCDIRRAMLKDT